METYHLSEENDTDKVFEFLLSAHEKSSLLTASTPHGRFREERRRNGVVLGNVYTKVC